MAQKWPHKNNPTQTPRAEQLPPKTGHQRLGVDLIPKIPYSKGGKPPKINRNQPQVILIRLRLTSPTRAWVGGLGRNNDPVTKIKAKGTPMPAPIDAITWDNLGQVAVLGTALSIFMQFIGKGFVKLLLNLVLVKMASMTDEQAEAWPGRSPVYFAFMLTIGLLLLLWRGLAPGPALITAVVAMCIASGEYEFVKASFSASGQTIVSASQPTPPDQPDPRHKCLPG